MSPEVAAQKLTAQLARLLRMLRGTLLPREILPVAWEQGRAWMQAAHSSPCPKNLLQLPPRRFPCPQSFFPRILFGDKLQC